jgi:FlaG/FlaF family flagellin (archaellin)
MGSKVFLPLVQTRILAAGIGALMFGMSGPAMAGETAITCTNPASGTSFQIKIDYDRSTVDTNPAEINDRMISWRDENRWNYTLDRKSGDLKIILASSTGGSFLYDRCRLEN